MDKKHHTMSELAQKHLKESQWNQWVYYDRESRDRDLKPDEHVLVLMPSSTRSCKHSG